MPDYVRIALSEEEFTRLLEILSDATAEPVVLKLRAKALQYQASQLQKAQKVSKKRAVAR